MLKFLVRSLFVFEPTALIRLYVRFCDCVSGSKPVAVANGVELAAMGIPAAEASVSAVGDLGTAVMVVLSLTTSPLADPNPPTANASPVAR